jgi:hypothetical protein
MTPFDEQHTRTRGKASLVEFLRSIQFRRRNGTRQRTDAVNAPFATLKPKVRPSRQHSAEDASLVRSAN